jgi:arsenite-transporting ATPase
MDDSLTISRIDPEAEVAAYREQVLAKAGAALDPESLALLEEDLRSPCTEEIAVFHAFARIVAEAADRFVVLDTAPTGHTLLLIDSSEAYHREVTRNTTDTPPQVLNLLPRLRDGDFTKVLIVTLAEATPVSEARRLQDDLARAGIAPYAWVVNQTFVGLQTKDPLLRMRGRNELPHIASVTTHHAKRTAVVPWVAVPPVGKGLEALVEAIDKEAAMSQYVYYCAECDTSFEAEVEHPEEGVPVIATCPDCGSEEAKKAFAVEATRPSGGCTPGSGCCG